MIIVRCDKCKKEEEFRSLERLTQLGRIKLKDAMHQVSPDGIPHTLCDTCYPKYQDKWSALEEETTIKLLNWIDEGDK